MTLHKTLATGPRTGFMGSYLEALSLVERLHRLLLDVIKDEFERVGMLEVNAVQALLLFNIGDNEVTAGELKTRGYYQGSNVSYNLKKLVEMGYMHHQRCEIDRRSVRVRLTPRGREIRDVVGGLALSARQLPDPHLEFAQQLAAHGAFEILETRSHLDETTRPLDHDLTEIIGKAGVGAFGDAVIRAGLLHLDDQGIHRDLREIESVIGGGRTEAVVVDPVARDVQHACIAGGPLPEKVMRIFDRMADGGGEFGIAAPAERDPVRNRTDGRRIAQHHPGQDHVLLDPTAPFEHGQGDGAIRLGQDRLDHLGGAQGLGQAPALQRILQRIHRGGDVHRQHQRQAAWLLRRSRAHPRQGQTRGKDAAQGERPVHAGAFTSARYWAC